MCDYVKNRFEKGYKQMNVLDSCKHTAGASMSMFNDFIANFEHYRIFCYCAINASFKQILTHGLNQKANIQKRTYDRIKHLW